MAFISNQTFIIIVALALAFVAVVAGLLVAVLYYRQRLHDSHRTLFRIVSENLDLHAKLDKPTNNSHETIPDRINI